MTRHARGFEAGYRVLFSGGKLDFRNAPQGRIVTGIAINDTTDGNGILRQPRIAAVKAIQRAKARSGMTDRADRRNLAGVIPVGKRFGMCICMTRARPLRYRFHIHAPVRSLA